MARFIALQEQQDTSLKRCIKANAIEMLSVEPDERKRGWAVGIYVSASESVIYERYATQDEAVARYNELFNLVEVLTQ